MFSSLFPSTILPRISMPLWLVTLLSFTFDPCPGFCGTFSWTWACAPQSHNEKDSWNGMQKTGFVFQHHHYHLLNLVHKHLSSGYSIHYICFILLISIDLVYSQNFCIITTNQIWVYRGKKNFFQYYPMLQNHFYVYVSIMFFCVYCESYSIF